MDGTLLIFTALVGLTIGATFGVGMTESAWRYDVIERGMGLYCPTTGEFAFMGECEK